MPARAGSKGVPGKNARLLAGQPLVVHTLRAAAASKRLTRVVVSTDSQAIAALAREHGATAPFLRPDDLASDESPMIDVVRHALTWLRDREGYAPSTVVLLQPTVPFRSEGQIDRAVSMLEASEIDSVVTVTRVPAHFSPRWQLTLRDGVLEGYETPSLADLPMRRQDLPETCIRDGAVYAFKTDAFWRTGSMYGARSAALVSEGPVINIDTPEDWDRAEVFAARLARGTR